MSYVRVLLSQGRNEVYACVCRILAAQCPLGQLKTVLAKDREI